jgi:hypothetical protein
MAEYRAYTVGPDGHFIGCEPLICSDDGEAVAKAKHLVECYDIEVWSGARFVARMESAESKAISVGGLRPASAVDRSGELKPLIGKP